LAKTKESVGGECDRSIGEADDERGDRDSDWLISSDAAAADGASIGRPGGGAQAEVEAEMGIGARGGPPSTALERETSRFLSMTTLFFFFSLALQSRLEEDCTGAAAPFLAPPKNERKPPLAGFAAD
jgi:hypothetical protein